VTKATLRASPRRVSETCSSALAASAPVTPRHDLDRDAAFFRKLISSWARPNNIGSPPFRRTTVW
jgi:hypothetical protein